MRHETKAAIVRKTYIGLTQYCDVKPKEATMLLVDVLRVVESGREEAVQDNRQE